MARQKIRDNDWSALGQMMIDVWSKRQGASGRPILEELRDPKTARATLEKYGVQFEKGIQTIVVHEDSDDKLHIVIPKNPWTPEELDRMSRIEAYVRELGIIVMGGCK